MKNFLRFFRKIIITKVNFSVFLLCWSFTVFAQGHLAQQLQKTLDAVVATSTVTPGAVLLVANPEIGTVVVASGFSDRSTKTPMHINNNFRIASITKTFIAVVILKLSDQEVLNLDDKVATLLPDSIDIERLPNGKTVTVRQLLAMRSGIPNYLDYDAFTEKVQEQPNLHWTPKDGIEIIYDEDANFTAGKSYEYSNTNYLLLQSIIEYETSSSLSNQLKKFILIPLQLNNTYLELHDDNVLSLKTHGYELQENGKLKDVTTLNDGLGLGDGGIISTAQDLKTFIQALLQTKILLSEKSLKEMLTDKGPDHYGLGIYREQVGDEMPWTHNGTSSGFSTQYYYFPKKELTIIILTNSVDSDIIDTLAAQVLNIIESTSLKQHNMH